MSTRKTDVRSVNHSGQPYEISSSLHNNHGVRVYIPALLIALLLVFTIQTFAADTPTVLHMFTGGPDGSYPDGVLVADAAGNLYGTTQIGGPYGFGTVFELSPLQSGAWQFTLLYAFTGGADGGNPLGGLTFDAAGNAYSTVSSGGANGLGAIFEISPNAQPGPGPRWKEKVLYSFQGGTDGAVPFGNVIFDAAGNLYGTTSIGGTTHIGCPPAKGCGTVFELAPTRTGPWKERIIHRFADAFGDGAEPRAGLVFDAAGNLYGTTYEGGDNEVCGGDGCGTVFEMSPASGGHWKFDTLVDFNATNGALVSGPITIGPDGALYGTTMYGGANNDGVIFSFTQQAGAWQFAVIYSFDNLDGLQPAGNIVLDQAGNIYGATYEGGANDWGSLFELTPSATGWNENLLYSFPVSGTHFGANALGGVMRDSAGNLYLTTNQGGNLNDCQPNSGCGAVIKFTP